MITSLDQLSTPEYRRLLKELHATRSWGGAGKHHGEIVRTYANKLGAVTILDYGCGRSTLKQVCPDLQILEFDPGIPGKDELPPPTDLVVATDVLEHAEPEYLTAMLQHIKYLSRLGTFFIIGLGPSKVDLPDGRNTHLIQQNPEWWLNAIKRSGFRISSHFVKKGLRIWAQ